MEKIGDKIRSLRQSQGMTLEELARFVGTSKQTIQRYETGIISNIPSDKIESLANALKTTPAYLMGWNNEFGSESPDSKRNAEKGASSLRSIARLEDADVSPELDKQIYNFIDFLLKQQKNERNN